MKHLVNITMIIIVTAFAVNAQTTEFNFQGSLKDGAIAATGNYDFEFRLYDAVSGGNQVGATLTRTNVAVSSGVFSVKLDFTGLPPSPFPGADRFLEIRVRNAGGGGYTILDPRQKVGSSPYAVKSLLAETANNATNAANAVNATNAINATNATNAVNFSGSLSGDVTGAQAATVVSTVGGQTAGSVANAASSVASAASANTPNTLVRRDAGGNFSAANITATGAVLNGVINMQNNVIANIGNAGTDFTATGGLNMAGSLSVAGGTVVIAAGTGDSTVQLPLSSVSATETSNEPGVASQTSNTLVGLAGTVQTLLSRDITVPTSGFVLVIGTLHAAFGHGNGPTSSAYFGVSDTAGTFPPNQNVPYYIPSAAASGTYFNPITVHGLFAVASGLNTFYLLGQDLSSDTVGTLTANNLQLSLLFVPTSYGSVTPTFAEKSTAKTVQPPDTRQMPSGKPARPLAENNVRDVVINPSEVHTVDKLKTEVDELKKIVCSLKPNAAACKETNE